MHNFSYVCSNYIANSTYAIDGMGMYVYYTCFKIDFYTPCTHGYNTSYFYDTSVECNSNRICSCILLWVMPYHFYNSNYSCYYLLRLGNSDKFCSGNGPDGRGGQYEVTCCVSRSGQYGAPCKQESVF